MNYPMMAIEGFTIYKKPASHPDHFVVRKWRIDSAGVYFYDRQALADTLEEARQMTVRSVMTKRFERHDYDHETIVESWI